MFSLLEVFLVCRWVGHLDICGEAGTTLIREKKIRQNTISVKREGKIKLKYKKAKSDRPRVTLG